MLPKVVFFMTHNYLVLKCLPDKIPHALRDGAVSFIITFHWTISSETVEMSLVFTSIYPASGPY